jgi:hypothetical protein
MVFLLEVAVVASAPSSSFPFDQRMVRLDRWPKQWLRQWRSGMCREWWSQWLIGDIPPSFSSPGLSTPSSSELTPCLMIAGVVDDDTFKCSPCWRPPENQWFSGWKPSPIWACDSGVVDVIPSLEVLEVSPSAGSNTCLVPCFASPLCSLWVLSSGSTWALALSLSNSLGCHCHAYWLVVLPFLRLPSPKGRHSVLLQLAA